ncbi:DUF6455 family protein [Salinarimonas rosea]|uniref:DUF6455 family protein n=1 Tax=Salinarimonas rosea TaxID=552063 RepID=UPI000418386C|nr:DUF6455 family protein [Salinarimonas rosea]
MTKSEGEGARALEARVEAQTILLMEMMRRLGVPPAAAQDEAARAAHGEAEGACAACAEQVACAAVLDGSEPLLEPPSFCANSDYVRRVRGH